jgi:hypothetical protein
MHVKKEGRTGDQETESPLTSFRARRGSLRPELLAPTPTLSTAVLRPE